MTMIIVVVSAGMKPNKISSGYLNFINSHVFVFVVLLKIRLGVLCVNNFFCTQDKKLL